MPESLISPITVPAKLADAFQITNVNLSFYVGGGEWTSCEMTITGRKGYGDGATFTTVDKLEASFSNQELADVLGKPISILPDNFDKENPDHIAALQGSYLWRVMLDLIVLKLNNKAVI